MQEDITELLNRWREGDQRAADALIPLVYDSLRRLARKQLSGERLHHTLHTTALVNEAYLKLAQQNRIDWKNREQFMLVASRLMRRILVDHARGLRAVKRGDGYHFIAMAALGCEPPDDVIDVSQLNDALDGLEQRDEKQCRIVESRFFGGLTLNEIARGMNMPLSRVKREWDMARAWLYQQLHE